MMTWTLPTYCYSCGAYLMGGATEHKPGCEVLRLIEETFAETEKPAPEMPEFKIVRFTNGSVGIHCFQCGNVSFNPNDVEKKYCGLCHKFHDPTKELK